jgi:WD40 repeat protein
LAFSPYGRYLAVGGLDGAATIWDARSGAKASASPKLKHSMEVTALAFSADGYSLAVLQNRKGDNSYRYGSVWHLIENRVVPIAHEGKGAGALGLPSLSPDGRSVAFRGSDTWLFDAVKGDPITELLGGPEYHAFVPDGRLIASKRDGTIVSLDPETREITKTFGKSRSDVIAVGVSASGSCFTAANYAGDLFAYTFSTGKLLSKWTGAAGGIKRLWTESSSKEPRVITFHESDGRVVAHLWSPGADRSKRSNLSGAVCSMAVTPDGYRIAFAYWTGEDNYAVRIQRSDETFAA